MEGNKIDSGGIRTHATEVTGALNQRLRPLGHAILVYLETLAAYKTLLKMFWLLIFDF